MSMTDSTAQGNSTGGNDTQTETETPDLSGQNQPVGTEGTQDDGSQGDLANPFLANVDEADRAIVGKYIKQWDSGVNRRFQDIRNQYKPYEQLGDIETLQQAAQLYTIFEQNPEAVYKMLHEQFGQQRAPQQQAPGYPAGNQQNLLGLDPNQLPEELAPIAPVFQQYGERFTQLDQRFGKVEQALNTIGQYILGQNQQTQQTQQDQELEKYIGLLKGEFGEFDEDYVLTKMLNGMKGEDAVKAYQTMVQQHVNQNRAAPTQIPAVLSGGGSTPTEPVDVTKLNKKDRVNLVADVLRRAQES